MNNKAKLSPPWIEFFRKIKELFKQDSNVKVEYDEDTYEIKIYVTGQEKASAIESLLPKIKKFGNVEQKITVIPGNKTLSYSDRLKIAFEGNKALVDIVTSQPIPGFSIDYFLFENKVVQFFNDNISTPNGMQFTLYQNIAREVFEDSMQPGVFFSTMPVDNI